MASPGPLRDQKGACFPSKSDLAAVPTQQQRGRDPRTARDACDAMDADRLRGVSLARYVEEPLRHVTDFLATKPAPHQVNDVLTLYKAFVVELACLANDIAPIEILWKNDGNARSRELAKKKFSKLKQGNPRINKILEAYRDAADRLDRSLRRHTEDMVKLGTSHLTGSGSRSGSTTGFLDVGRMVSSGFEMLFGDSSTDELDWNGSIMRRSPSASSHKPDTGQNTPISIRSSISRNSSVASAPPSSRPTEGRAEREARRKARELGVIPSGYEMMREHQIPPLELSPSIWSGQSSPTRSRHSHAPLFDGTPLDGAGTSRSNSTSSSPCSAINKPVQASITNTYDRSYRDPGTYGTRTRSQPSTPGRRTDHPQAPEKYRPKSTPPSPRHWQGASTFKPSSAKAYASGKSDSRPGYKSSPSGSASGSDEMQQKTVFTPDELQHVVVKREYNKAIPASILPEVKPKGNPRAPRAPSPIPKAEIKRTEKTSTASMVMSQHSEVCIHQRATLSGLHCDKVETPRASVVDTQKNCSVERITPKLEVKAGYPSGSSDEQRHVTKPKSVYISSSADERSPGHPHSMYYGIPAVSGPSYTNTLGGSTERRKPPYTAASSSENDRRSPPQYRNIRVISRSPVKSTPTATRSRSNVETSKCPHPHHNRCSAMSVPAQSRSRSSSPPGRKPHAHWCTEAHRTPSCNTAQPASDTNDVRRLTKDNMRLVKLNEQKDAELCQLRADSKSQWTDHDRKMKDMTRRMREKETESRSAFEQLEKTKDLLACCESQLVAAQTELSDCQQELKNNRRTLRAENNAGSNRVEELETFLAQSNDRRRAAEGAKSNCEAQLNIAEKSIQRLTLECDNLMRENGRLDLEAREAEHAFFKKMRTERNELQFAMQEYETRFKQANEENKAFKSQCDSLQAELMKRINSQPRMSNVSDETLKLDFKCKEWEKKYKDLQNETTKQERRISHLTDQNQKLKEETEDWNKKYSKLQANIRSLKSQLDAKCSTSKRADSPDQGPGTSADESGTRSKRYTNKSDSYSTACTDCERMIATDELKCILDSMHNCNLRQASCHDCRRKDEEMCRLAKQLQCLYDRASLTGEPAGETSDSLKKENDRLNSELRSAQMELQSLRHTPGPARLNQKCEHLETEVQDLRERIKTLTVEKSKLSEQAIKECSQKRTDCENEMRFLNEELKKIKEQLLSTKSQQSSECDRLLMKEKELEGRISELNRTLTEVKRRCNEERAELSFTVEDCERAKKRMAEKQKEIINTKNDEIKRLTDELYRLRDGSMSDYQSCMQENSELKRQTAQLQLEFDLLTQSAKSGEICLKDLIRMKSHITHLETEITKLQSVRDKHGNLQSKTKDKDAEINRLKHELKLAQKDIEIYHKGQSPSGSTAYIVRMRDQTITHLHEKIAEFERTNRRNRDGRARSVSPVKDNKNTLHRTDKSEMLLIMTDETSRMKDKMKKLENDNIKLIELVKQRDAKMFEMKNEMDWLVKGSTQRDMITTYTQKLKEGEEEMAHLHQTMDVLTKKHSTLLLAKENEILEVRTHYAQQLSQLINECVNRNECQEGEMKNLCRELDNLEKRNFELEKAFKDYEVLKSEHIPKLRADLESLRKARSELRQEFDHCNHQLMEAQRDIEILEKDKLDTLRNHEVELANKQDELDNARSQLDLYDHNKQAVMRQRDIENQRLRDEVNNITAALQERDGSVTYWKIKHEDTNRQIDDVEERHALVLKAKNKEINTLVYQVEELTRQVDRASSVNDAELFRLQSQLKELQRQHMDILEQNETTMKLKEEEMRRLYSEIGDMSAHLHTTNKEKECEIDRLRQEQALLREERNSILSDSQVTVQEKQAEIRKLTADLERMEVESARLHANKNQEVAAIQQEYKQKMEQFTTDRAHLIAIKDNEIGNMRQELEKLMQDAKSGGSSISELKKKIFSLEQDRAELLMLKDQWQADIDKLYSEYEACKSDKVEYEEMVDRLSLEMEDRIEGLKMEHNETIAIKDNHIRDLYSKVEKIAKDRGEMSQHLHMVVQEKEQTISDLFSKLKEYDKCLDEAEATFKHKLQERSQEIKRLREQIRKMGEEGVRLLDMREREINEMRAHLKNMLKVYAKKQMTTSSHVLITRPPRLKQHEPHLKSSQKPSPGNKKLTRSSSQGGTPTPKKKKQRR